LTELLATTLTRKKFVNYRVHLRFSATPFAKIEPTPAVEVILREADLRAATPKAKLSMRKVRVEIP
jgi:hypothetical protein